MPKFIEICNRSKEGSFGVGAADGSKTLGYQFVLAFNKIGDFVYNASHTTSLPNVATQKKQKLPPMQ